MPSLSERANTITSFSEHYVDVWHSLRGYKWITLTALFVILKRNVFLPLCAKSKSDGISYFNVECLYSHNSKNAFTTDPILIDKICVSLF